MMLWALAPSLRAVYLIVAEMIVLNFDESD
jgi:hypothetical protein